MAIILGVILGLAVLYFWLCGNWFARIVVTPPIWGILLLFSNVLPQDMPLFFGLIYVVGAMVLAWVLSGVPIRVANRRIQSMVHSKG